MQTKQRSGNAYRQPLHCLHRCVRQGEAALKQDSSGFDILIDGRKTSAGPTVIAYLRAQEVDDIDFMVASHADSDHIRGLIKMLEMTDNPKALAKMQLNRLAPTG
jgi:beta-lactamase superfamily II metal-dependent hydrolase